MNKNRTYIIITGLVAATLVWLSQNNRNQELKSQTPLGEELLDENTNTTNILEGALWTSGDKTKGNLVLINSEATIYIKTSRDFSNLVGKRVIVSVEGSSDAFTLIDIQENLTKDGYIKVE